jgi:hypothetical protein
LWVAPVGDGDCHGVISPKIHDHRQSLPADGAVVSGRWV